MSADREREDRGDLQAPGDGGGDAELHGAAHAAARGEAEGPHPEAEELVAFAEGRLPEPRAERVRSHLAACPDCTDLVVDYAAFPDLGPPEGRERLGPEAVEDARRRFAAEHPPPAAAPASRGRSGGGYRLLALAAGVAFVLTLGWALWQLREIGELREEVAELRQEVGSLEGSRLYPVNTVTWDAADALRGETEMVEVPEDGSLVLQVLLREAAGVWDLVVRSPQGEVVVRRAALRPGEDGVLELGLDLAPGSYRLELRDAGGGETHVRVLKVVRPPEDER